MEGWWGGGLEAWEEESEPISFKHAAKHIQSAGASHSKAPPTFHTLMQTHSNTQLSLPLPAHSNPQASTFSHPEGALQA